LQNIVKWSQGRPSEDNYFSFLFFANQSTRSKSPSCFS